MTTFLLCRYGLHCPDETVPNTTGGILGWRCRRCGTVLDWRHKSADDRERLREMDRARALQADVEAR